MIPTLRSMYASLALLLLCAPGVAQEARPSAPGPRALRQESREQEDTLERRNAWFYNRRKDATGQVPAGARLRALRQFERMVRDSAQTRSALPRLSGGGQLPPPTGAWVPIGPQPTLPAGDPSGGWPNASGRVSALAIDPRNNNVVYAGGAEGGVWKTTDGGTSWTPLTDTQASLAIGSIALAPSNPDVIYVGTGEENFSDSYYGAGVLKSTDAGATWTQLAGPFVGPFGPTQSNGDGGAEIGGIAVSPTNPNVVLAGVMKSTFAGGSFSASGIYRTSDGGQNWTQVLAAGGVIPFSVVFDPTDPTHAYTAMSNTMVEAATKQNHVGPVTNSEDNHLCSFE